jgi:hypothetical protein
VPSSAQKKSAPLNSVRRLGLEAAVLGFTSFTSFVPAAVPSLPTAAVNPEVSLGLILMEH